MLPTVRSELTVISDVSALLSIDALRITASRLQDKSVAVLTGRYLLLNPGSAGESAYWQYQTAIKQAEASLGATLGVHGGFYAVRTGLVDRLPANTINDDFILPMRIVAKGYRAVYELDVHAVELEQATSTTDQYRRRRIAAGNLQQLLWLWQLLLPRYRGIAFAFASGKALRVVMPFLMLSSLFGSLMLAPGSWPFAVLGIGQLLLYGMAASHYLVSGHIQGLLGVVRYLAGLERGRWQRVNS